MTHGRPRKTFDWMTRQERQQKNHRLLPTTCGVQKCVGFASRFIRVDTDAGPQYHPRCDDCASEYEQL